MVGISDRLQAETETERALLHANPLMVALLRGSITRERYVAHLVQLRAIHLGVENIARSYKDLQAILTPDQHRRIFLDEDLESLGRDRRMVLVATDGAVDCLASATYACPFSLLGAFYILEGEARDQATLHVETLRHAFGLETKGLRYVIGHGAEGEPVSFSRFKSRLDARVTSQAEQEQAVGVAKSTLVGLDTIYRIVASR